MDAYVVSPSPSSSSSICEKYDVFLSFRGEDTRDNFTSHLYAALRRKQIKTYIDEVSLERGDKIHLALPEAIQKSEIAIIIFSKDYASSSWCLRELEHILKCHAEKKKMIIPIFYGVDPSDIRKQKGSYEKSFIEHENRFKNNLKMVEKWRLALTESANLSGWDSRVTKPDSKLVDEVVKDVLKKLCGTVLSSSADGLKGLIGMQKHFQQLQLLLSIGSPNVRIIALWGMGGIGKSTLANAVYGQFFSQFESCCFLKNVREESKKVHDGLEKLRKMLIEKLLGEKNVDLETPSSLEIVKRRLKGTRVLIVLDDVSRSMQLEHLVGDGDQFASGSRILVTTRDLKVLRTIKGGAEVETHVYKVEQLNDSEALDLFNLTAFDEGKPPTSDYTEVSKQAVYYAGRIPLAIKVLGSELRCLREQKIEKWEMTLNRFKKSPPADIHEVLKISYEGLEKDAKNIFLDIACFFKGMGREFVENILNACDFSASTGIDNLMDKSLITIDPEGNELQMHDLVQEMGREIVCQESEKKEERSRLWIMEDIIHVLENNLGTANIQGIFLNDYGADRVIHLEPTIFEKMCNLRLLQIHCPVFIHSKHCLHFEHGLQYLPNTLRYLEWSNYPLESLPPNFKPKNLVELKMGWSQLKQLCYGGQVLKKLRGIDLSWSSNLTRIPDVSTSPDLERINLARCRSLLEVAYSQIQKNLNNLIDVNLDECDKLQSVPDIILNASSLRTLLLGGCSNLNTLPLLITTRSLVSLNLRSTAIKDLTLSNDSLPSLSKLDLTDCKGLVSLSGVNNLNSLKILRLSGCSNLEMFPELPSNIEELSIGWTAIKEVDFPSIMDLKLRMLDLSHCSSLETLPPSIFKLRFLSSLSLSGCRKLKNLPDISEPMESLTDLSISKTEIRKLPSSLFENLIGLQSFTATKSKIEEIPESINCASKLRTLNIADCRNLRSIQVLPLSLKYLMASGCTLLEVVSFSERALTQEFHNNYLATQNTSQFFDCFKLGQEARHNIITEFQRRVLHVATRFRSLEHQGRNLKVRTCYPGNTIPKWFDLQSKGCRIEIMLRDNNFLGFVLCAVVDSTDMLDLQCYLNLKTNQGENHKYTRRVYYPSDYSSGSTSDHVFMWYEHEDYSEYYCTADEVRVSFDFLVNGLMIPPKGIVKKCGIHVLYREDLEKFNLNFVNGENGKRKSNSSYWTPKAKASRSCV